MSDRSGIVSKIHRVSLDRRKPPIDVYDLATMLEIDLTVMGDKTMFRRRLQRALNDACGQGARFKTGKGMPHNWS